MNKKNYLIICGLIIFLILFVWYVYVYSKNKNLILFSDKIFGAFVIFLPIGIFITYGIFKKQSDSIRRDSTYKIIDRGWTNVNKELIINYKDCPSFVDSLYFDWQIKIFGKSMKYNDYYNNKWYTVMYLSMIIFQSWEDFLTSYKIDQTGANIWINNFLQWSNSKFLRNNWSIFKSNYSYTAQKLGDYLFSISSKYKPKNINEIEYISNKIIESKKFIDIINQRH